MAEASPSESVPLLHELELSLGTTVTGTGRGEEEEMGGATGRGEEVGRASSFLFGACCPWYEERVQLISHCYGQYSN